MDIENGCGLCKKGHNNNLLDSNRHKRFPPRTVEGTASRPISEMTLKYKIEIAGMGEDDLRYLHLTMAERIRYKFNLEDGNVDLLESCRIVTDIDDLHVDDAPTVIISILWERLKASHSFGVLK